MCTPTTTAAFHPPDDALIAGLRETSRHRAEPPEVRIGQRHGSPGPITFWVHVDQQRQVLDVRDFQSEPYWPLHYQTDALIEAVRRIKYRPFLRNGVAAEAWVQDQLQVGAAPDPVSSDVANFPKPPEPAAFSIQLSRSPCYGICPSYSVVIHGDGLVEFHGEKFVAIPGDYQTHIAPGAALQLLEQFRRANFFELKDNYHAPVTDNPTFRLELTVGTTKKTVVDYVGTWVGMPDSITGLENAVDKAAGTDRWVHTGPQTLAAMHDAGIAPNSKQAEEILYYAVRFGQGEAVRNLLAAGAPVRTDESTHSSKNLLETASFLHDQEQQQAVFSALLENATVRADKAGLQEALGRVVGAGNVEVARKLIAAGADPTQLFHDDSDYDAEPDQTYLMLAASSGVWDMLDDALSRPHNIHAVDKNGRSVVGRIVWFTPQNEDIFPLVDRLLAAGASKDELTKTLADTCRNPYWRDGLIKRGADSKVCSTPQK